MFSIRRSLSIFGFLIIVFFSSSGFSQVPSKTIYLDLVDGIGPRGNLPLKMHKIDQADSITKRLLGVYDLSIYQDIDDKVEYYYILNPFQFYYQNYRAGSITEDAFRILARANGRQLTDTLMMSDQPLVCVVRMLVGRKQAGSNYICIIDGNQNNTYQDDDIQDIPYAGSMASETIQPISVPIAIISNNGIQKKFIKISPVIDGMTWPSISIKSFYFARFAYKGEKYMVCAEMWGRMGVYILPDRPFFSPVPRNILIPNLGKVNLGKDVFTLMYNRFGPSISLTRADSSDAPIDIPVEHMTSHETRIPFSKTKEQYLP